MEHHHYKTTITWKGNLGEGTSSYQSYKRQHLIAVDGKPNNAGSSMAGFNGDADRSNPEDLLLASVSACHMLWYLHMCAAAGIVIIAYQDHAEGTMAMKKDGSG